jgi:glucose-6-phosphate isomerase
MAMPFELSDRAAGIKLDWQNGKMVGAAVKESRKQLKDLAGIFHDQARRKQTDPETTVYRVQWWEPAAPGSEGGLFWGVTTIFPGRAGDEYFMTHGHFHSNRTRAEFYGTVEGEGMLVLMDEDRHTWSERMTPGSLHYIDGRHAHRAVNTGDTPLIFWACWPTDAGYDYATIREQGFGARVLSVNGKPTLVMQQAAHHAENL